MPNQAPNSSCHTHNAFITKLTNGFFKKLRSLMTIEENQENAWSEGTVHSPWEIIIDLFYSLPSQLWHPFYPPYLFTYVCPSTAHDQPLPIKLRAEKAVQLQPAALKKIIGKWEWTLFCVMVVEIKSKSIIIMQQQTKIWTKRLALYYTHTWICTSSLELFSSHVTRRHQFYF